jgi:hypothetical protein
MYQSTAGHCPARASLTDLGQIVRKARAGSKARHQSKRSASILIDPFGEPFFVSLRNIAATRMFVS